MAGNKYGAMKARDVNLKRDPDFYKRIGAIGGSRKVPKGFAKLSKERLFEVASEGGRVKRDSGPSG